MEKQTLDPSANVHVRKLAERIRGLDVVFSCGGTVALDEPVDLQVRGAPKIRVARAEGWKRDDVGKRIAKHCTRAAFGVGRATHRDSRVRDEGQLLARGGGFRVAGLDLEETGILAEIQRVLCGDGAATPVADLYALNVYGRGGHFVTHKDTPRDPEVFGTLVACLLVPFRGGRLVLRRETTRSYEWEPPSFYGCSRRDEHRAQHRHPGLQHSVMQRLARILHRPEHAFGRSSLGVRPSSWQASSSAVPFR